VLCLPGAILIGFAFAACGMAGTSYMRSWHDFDLVQMCVLPMFLFSTTFYPLSTYSEPVQLIVQCTPLYQGVAMLRALTTGTPTWATLGHAVYLAVMGLAGLTITARRLERLLLT
jgi:lipooligosaccharide transport system permease protein